jgi:polyisoprenoid-binding protein YceI
MKLTPRNLSALAGLALIPFSMVPALAADFTVLDASKSTIGFAFKQMNVPSSGAFRKVSGTIDFDPDKPAQAKAEIDVALASVDAGSDEASEALADSLWFDTKAFPIARFITTSFIPLADNKQGDRQYKVVGDMTIKGQTHPIESVTTFHQEGDTGVFEGAFTLKRAEFKIGTGMWADFGTVANEVQIKFRLVTHAAASQK